MWESLFWSRFIMPMRGNGVVLVLMFRWSAMCLKGFSANPLFSCRFYGLTLYRSHWIGGKYLCHVSYSYFLQTKLFLLGGRRETYGTQGNDRNYKAQETKTVVRFTWLSKVLSKGIGSHWRGEDLAVTGEGKTLQWSCQELSLLLGWFC